MPQRGQRIKRKKVTGTNPCHQFVLKAAMLIEILGSLKRTIFYKDSRESDQQNIFAVLEKNYMIRKNGRKKNFKVFMDIFRKIFEKDS